MAFYSGFGGRVMIRDGTTNADKVSLPAGHWSLNIKADPIDCTTFEHIGVQDVIANVTEFDITVDCYWNNAILPVSVATDPFAPTGIVGAGLVDLIPGGNQQAGRNPSNNYISVRLDLERGDTTRSFSFTRVYVTNMMVDTDVRGIVKYTFSCKGTRAVAFGDSAPTRGSFTGIFPTAG